MNGDFLSAGIKAKDRGQRTKDERDRLWSTSNGWHRVCLGGTRDSLGKIEGSQASGIGEEQGLTPGDGGSYDDPLSCFRPETFRDKRTLRL